MSSTNVRELTAHIQETVAAMRQDIDRSISKYVCQYNFDYITSTVNNIASYPITPAVSMTVDLDEVNEELSDTNNMAP